MGMQTVSSHAAGQYDDVARKTGKPFGQTQRMVFSFGQDHRRTFVFQRLQHVVENQRITRLIRRKRRIELLDWRTFPLESRRKHKAGGENTDAFTVNSYRGDFIEESWTGVRGMHAIKDDRD